VDEALGLRDAALSEGAAALAKGAAELSAERANSAELEKVCARLATRVVDRERELEKLRVELTRMRAQGDHRLGVLTEIAEDLKGVRRQARGQATRIRLRALRDAVELSERISELSRRPEEARDRLLEALYEAIARIGAGDEEQAEVEPAFGVRPATEMFEGRVEVDVGPLEDFSQLVGFEDAAGGIGATSEISVTRFTQGRATLEMKLTQPVELLRELEQRTPFGFRVRDQRADRVVLDVDNDAQAA
jgi:hypothetical protein